VRACGYVLLLQAAVPSLVLAQEAATRDIVVVASQFAFDPARIEVQRGDQVRLVFRSLDVPHGFELDGYNLSVIVPAGPEGTSISFIADRVGTFPFRCTVYCGMGHDGMQGMLVVSEAGQTSAGAEVEPTRPEPDFTLVNQPTNLRLPARRFAFRVTHHFARPLGRGSFGDLAGDLFGLDGGAQIGLELRYGLVDRVQVGVYRTSDRTIQLSVQPHVFEQGQGGVPFGLSAVVSVEGLDNFSEDYSPSVAAVLSRRLWSRLDVYFSPGWVGNLVPTADESGSAVVLGYGGRFRVRPSFGLVGEVAPRFGEPDDLPVSQRDRTYAAFGIEGIWGGHVFQLNFANDIATTPAQRARSQSERDEWFIGFNISRKFY